MSCPLFVSSNVVQMCLLKPYIKGAWGAVPYEWRQERQRREQVLLT